VLCQPQLAEILAKELKDKIWSRIGTVDWVVGSPYAAITFSYELARQLGARHGFPEKDPKNPGQLVWNPGRLTIPSGAFVLQCEELITTLGTTEKVRDAVVLGNPNPVQFFSLVAAGVYRPASFEGASREVVALIEREVKSWQPSECPLCRQGSEPLRPREGQNWAKLTGRG
jgi:orotate phosphoribosyltransferase